MTGVQARRRWVLSAFGVYALALFTATHIPRLTIPLPGRPDLFVHAAVFGAWTALLIACAFFGPALSRRNVLWCVVIATGYSALDEGLQAIPALHRTAAWDDWGANMIGVVGVGAAALLAGMARGRAAPPPTIAPEIEP